VIKIKSFYIQEADKPNIIKELFCFLNIENNKIILPTNGKYITEKEAQKLVLKIIKKMKKNNTKYIVLSKNLKNNQMLLNKIREYNVNLFDGHWLWNYMIYETVEYVEKKTNKKMEEIELALMINTPTKEIIENIKIFAKEFKVIKIITPNIKIFNKLEEKIYNDFGIMIHVTNNMKKSLVKSDIIVNFDFTKNEINKYNLFENAIIINIKGDVKIDKKRFNGININDYEIKSKRAEEIFSIEDLKKFYLKDLFEAEIYRKDFFENIKKDITKGGFEIKELYRVNGIL